MWLKKCRKERKYCNLLFWLSPNRSPSLSAERTSSSKESVFTSRMLSPNMGTGSLIARPGSAMVSGPRRSVATVVGWGAAPTVVWLTSAPLAWTPPWWPLLRPLYRVVGVWWVCWRASSRRPPQAAALVGQVQAGTRVSLSAQATATTAPARPVWAGAQGQTLRLVVVGLAQVLGPAWSQSPLGGVCKLSVYMVSIVREMSLLKSLFLVLMRIWKLNTWVIDVLYILRKKELKI